MIAAGIGTLLLGLAAPAVATTTRLATPSRPAPSRPAPSAASRPAVPNPDAPRSGQVVPGLTGAAARKQDPPISASRRFAQLNAVSHAAGGSSAAGNDGALRLPAAKAATAQPDALPPWSGAFHGAWGTFPGQTIYGAQATQSLNPGIVAPATGSQFIYSPTLDPSGIDTIEMSTIYDAGGNYVGAWDWGAASPSFAKTAKVTATFLATYATKISGQYYYSVRNVQANATKNTWTAYLYNYTTSKWDTFYTSSDTGKLSNSGGGWDMNEVYTDYNSAAGEGDYCTVTKGDVFASTNLKYQLTSGGAWTPATTANSSTSPAYPRGADLGCDNTGYALPTLNSSWNVASNTHGADELKGGQSGKCVDTNQVKFANRTKEQIYTCNGGKGQEWTYTSSGQLTVDGGKYCLDVSGQHKTPGTLVDLWSCNGGENQQWSFSIKHMLVGEQSGLCLEVAKASTSNGGQLELGTCTAAVNEAWSWK
jgi:hypothetical protein